MTTAQHMPPDCLAGGKPPFLKLLSEGRSLSEATVKFHLKNIYAKLGVSRRGMAVSVSKHLKLTDCE